MPDGGTLVIAAHGRHFGQDASDLTAGDYVVLSVTDTGAGMSPEVAAKALLRPVLHHQASRPGHGPRARSGLYGIARQCGGTALIQSEVGKGTCVSIILRRAEAPAPVLKQPDGVIQHETDSREILLIDDDEAVRDTLHDMLVELGYAVRSAATGPSGLELLEGRTPDLVLLDYANAANERRRKSPR